MSNELEKRAKTSVISENMQHMLALSVVGVMLYVIGLPAFVIFFIGAFAFFLWKLFSTSTGTETRRIFEFYLVANEILRSDDRRWYGFEIQEAIARGEKIVALMNTPPPLAYFALGCLYHKKGDNSAAIKDLERVLEEGGTNETSIVFPTKELREYVRILRRIERDPADAPQTSAAIRSLERLRKNKGKSILDDARHRVHEDPVPKLTESAETSSDRFVFFENADDESIGSRLAGARKASVVSRISADDANFTEVKKSKGNGQSFSGRKPISEVLQDIYDEKVS